MIDQPACRLDPAPNTPWLEAYIRIVQIVALRLAAGAAVALVIAGATTWAVWP